MPKGGRRRRRGGGAGITFIGRSRVWRRAWRRGWLAAGLRGAAAPAQRRRPEPRARSRGAPRSRIPRSSAAARPRGLGARPPRGRARRGDRAPAPETRRSEERSIYGRSPAARWAIPGPIRRPEARRGGGSRLAEPLTAGSSSLRVSRGSAPSSGARELL